jgi:endonuclease/exonuclease/phosphatase family metal-dependent hydrolase
MAPRKSSPLIDRKVSIGGTPKRIPAARLSSFMTASPDDPVLGYNANPTIPGRVERKQERRVTVLLSWNIQYGKGRDGRVDLGRIAAVARSRGPVDVPCPREIAIDHAGMGGGDTATDTSDHQPVWLTLA